MLNNKKADPNIPDNNRRTALMFASFEGHLRIVELLLRGNANPNICNKQGSTALKFAMQNSHQQIVELLDSDCHNIAEQVDVQPYII